MRTEKFKSALLSTLLIGSLMAPVITLLSVSSATLASAQINYTIIVRGKENALNVNQDPEPPWREYVAGDRPPIMAAKSVGLGKVVAAGFVPTCRNGQWNDTRNPHPHLDNLLHHSFQWMVSGATKVLWWNGGPLWGQPGDVVYNNTTRCSQLVENLRLKYGYTIGTDTRAFSAIENLTVYDILVIPQLQLGTSGTGGDPTKLPDSEVAVIENFVKVSGKGLLIMEGSDYAGHNYYKVQNKILKALGMGIYFQSDQVTDPFNNYAGDNFRIIADVDNTTAIGSDYQTSTEKTVIGLYSVCSLAEVPDRKVVVSISPGYRMGLAGGTLFYTVKVTNMGSLDDTYSLTVSDNAIPSWGPTISPTSLTIPGFFGENSAVLSVTIPGGASIGDSDNITVTATSTENTAIKDNKWCLAIADTRIKPTTADAQVVQGAGFENRNYGKDTYAYVGSSATAYKDERVFLKFDLRAMGTAVENIRLYIYKFRLSGAPDKNVELRRVDNDNWDELKIRWTDQPSYGTTIGTALSMPDGDLWYSWDVKDYVLLENAGDRVASFCMRAENEGLAFPDNFSYGFSTKEYGISGQHPYLIVGPRVWTRIVQRYQVGMPGGTLSYKVLVQNVGALHDTYNLTVGDNSGWSPTVSPSSLTLAPGAFGYATVTVTIPGDALIGENIDNITVVATSTVDPTVSDNYWCTASVSSNIIRPPVDDSTVKENEPVSNIIWGTDDTIYVGRYFEGPERGFLKFDLSAIPSGTSIARARLWLNAYRVDNVGLVVPVVQVRSVASDAWIERGAGRLMWGNQPSIGGVLDVRAIIENRRYYWDVTSFVQGQFAGDKVASFALVDLGENIAPDHRARFTSKEYGVRENHPYLEILTAAPSLDVRVYISPVFQGTSDNATTVTLSYTVTVANRGSSADTYSLENLDGLGWSMSVSPTSLAVPAGENRSATLSVTVPVGAACALDRITVVATSQTDPAIKDSAACFAHRGRAAMPALFNVYTVALDLDQRIREDTTKLSVKFYKWTNEYQGENILSGVAPVHLTGSWNVKHPIADTGVENAHLVLTLKDGTEIILARFTTRRSALVKRISGIKSEWPYADAPRRSELLKEISKIKSMWPYAPT